MINITSLTILGASLFRISPSFSRRLYHAENLWLAPSPTPAKSQFRNF